ncbi:hypothetical protein M407DRAFT_35003 [Tulasnella calospora MUT 4182]|uniref:Uncharacterized protein n=1 Tax=Tulasnella calospora MUT 4182 TaxID=1051891 RepID=A0A0C3Q0G1_9AGAM|nr:hypothetical protein M407DRAFT_35003 [Tulasnella calospora MUT 4182]
MASGLPMGAGHPRNNLRRNLANKTMGVPIGYFRPGTPYPKIGNVPLVAGPGGSLQPAQMGGRPAAYPLADQLQITVLQRQPLPITLTLSSPKTLGCVMNSKNFEHAKGLLAALDKWVVSILLSPMRLG